MVSRSSMVDYYKELGVHRQATSNDIRTAYKRLALIWHPDRNKAKDAEDKFKKIKHAYDVLIDENQRREYDRQLNLRSEKKKRAKNVKYAQPYDDTFHLHAFDHVMSAPIDPFDILNDIQFFQESDFTSKMMDSPSYRNLYTEIFNSMNDPRRMHSSSPIFLDNDRLFPPKPKPPSSTSPKHASINPIPVIHSTLPNDWFLNQLIDLHEQQNPASYIPFHHDLFFDDLIDCTNCHRKIFPDRSRLIQHEQQCRKTLHQQHPTYPSKSVRV